MDTLRDRIVDENTKLAEELAKYLDGTVCRVAYDLFAISLGPDNFGLVVHTNNRTQYKIFGTWPELENGTFRPADRVAINVSKDRGLKGLLRDISCRFLQQYKTQFAEQVRRRDEAANDKQKRDLSIKRLGEAADLYIHPMNEQSGRLGGNGKLCLNQIEVQDNGAVRLTTYDLPLDTALAVIGLLKERASK